MVPNKINFLLNRAVNSKYTRTSKHSIYCFTRLEQPTYTMDFNFAALFENSQRLKSGSQDFSEDDVDDYFDNYSDYEEEDSDDEWMAEYRMRKMNSEEKDSFQIGLSNEDKHELVEQGKDLLINMYQYKEKFQQRYFNAASIKPIPTDLNLFSDHHDEIEEINEEEFDADEEEGLASLDRKVFDFTKDQIVSATINLLSEFNEKVSPAEDRYKFQLYYQDFLTNFKGYNYKYNRLNFFGNLDQVANQDHKDEISRILNYEELATGVLDNIFIIYITSGGGKTTMFKKFKNYVRFLDVDQFIHDNYESFLAFQNYIQRLDPKKSQGIMSLWFKYKLDQYNRQGKLKDSILLFNHPNQLPLYFRKRINELIIMPKNLNWETRFFKENYFSLACVKNKHIVVLEYKYYLYYALEFFSKLFSPNRIIKLILKEIYQFKPFVQKKRTTIDDNPEDGHTNSKRVRKEERRRTRSSTKKAKIN